MPVFWSDLHPDESVMVSSQVIKDFGNYELTAPAGATHLRIGLIGTGGQGENYGGNSASARRKARVTPGEVFQLQVGECGTGGTRGDTWFRRKASGEMLCYADRGRGTGGVQGAAIRCIGDRAWDGTAAGGAGSDAAEPLRLGLGGRPGALDGRRAPGPGGAGAGRLFPAPDIGVPAGQGYAVLEWYNGDPGSNY